MASERVTSEQVRAWAESVRNGWWIPTDKLDAIAATLAEYERVNEQREADRAYRRANDERARAIVGAYEAGTRAWRSKVNGRVVYLEPELFQGDYEPVRIVREVEP